jgi:hypothetical protein
MSSADKIKGFCECFSTGNNKLGLDTSNTNLCNCEANDLKFCLLSKKYQRKITLTKCLIKLNIFNINELKDILNELWKIKVKHTEPTIERAKAKLRKENYYVFYDDKNIIKCFDKNKI